MVTKKQIQTGLISMRGRRLEVLDEEVFTSSLLSLDPCSMRIWGLRIHKSSGILYITLLCSIEINVIMACIPSQAMIADPLDKLSVY